MALGGGTFLTQNKVLPGSYINFVSIKKASANLADRGYVTLPMELDWGVDSEVFEVTNGDFQKNSLSIFGYDYTSPKLKGLRDLFLNAKVLYCYRLNSGIKASNIYAEAKCSGTRGNDISISIRENIDDSSLFDVITLFDDVEVDSQTVDSSDKLVANDYVTWKSFELATGLKVSLANGENGVVTGQSHQDYLGKIENYSFNIIGVVTEDDVIKQLYSNFTKRMRDEVGAKFQCVLHNFGADYEGAINLKNDVTTEEWSKASLVYWVAGLQGSCAVNKSCLNKKYVGEFDVNAEYSQSQLEKAVKNGEFVIHKSNGEFRTLMDVNSLVQETDEKGEAFKDNQTIRVLDQIANDIALLFNTRYVGEIPNDNAGRVSLWADIVKHHEELEKIRAITNFTDADVTVEQGDDKKSVLVYDRVEPVNAMAKMYMVVRVA